MHLGVGEGRSVGLLHMQHAAYPVPLRASLPVRRYLLRGPHWKQICLVLKVQLDIHEQWHAFYSAEMITWDKLFD